MKPKKERVVRALQQNTKLKNFEKSGLGIFLVRGKYELRKISIPTKFKKMKQVPRKTKLLLDLNNNQYKISGIRAENTWKSGKAIKTTTKLPSKFTGLKLHRGKRKSVHRITEK